MRKMRTLILRSIDLLPSLLALSPLSFSYYVRVNDPSNIAIFIEILSRAPPFLSPSSLLFAHESAIGDKDSNGDRRHRGVAHHLLELLHVHLWEKEASEEGK